MLSSSFLPLFPAGTYSAWCKCHIDSLGPPHLTQILLLTWKMARRAKPRGSGKRNASSAHRCCIRLLIDCNISLHCALLHSPCLPPLAPHSSPPSPFEPTLDPRGRSTIQTGQLHLQCPHPPFSPFLQSTDWSGLLSRPSWGNEHWSKAWWGWAEWMGCQTSSFVMRDLDSCRLRWGRYGFLSTPQQKRLPCQKNPKEGVNVGGTRAWGSSQGSTGEYGLRLWFIKSVWMHTDATHKSTHCAHTRHYRKFLIIGVLETPPSPPSLTFCRGTSLSMQYSGSSSVYVRFNLARVTSLSLGCLFRDVPLGAQEVTGDSWGRKRK